MIHLLLPSASKLPQPETPTDIRGKGSKYRVVPLNVDARRAIEAYLQVRPSSSDDPQSRILCPITPWRRFPGAGNVIDPVAFHGNSSVIPRRCGARFHRL